MDSKISIHGIKELQAKFTRLSNQGHLIAAVNQALGIVEASAKLNTPVDTGNLRNSTHIKSAHSEGTKVTGSVYNNAEYAKFVEFGVGVKASGSYPYKTKIPLAYSSKDKWVYSPDGGETFKVAYSRPAQPFLGKALNQNKQKIQSIIKQGVSSSIGKG